MLLILIITTIYKDILQLLFIMDKAISLSKSIDFLIALGNIAKMIFNPTNRILCCRLYFITLLQKFLKENKTSQINETSYLGVIIIKSILVKSLVCIMRCISLLYSFINKKNNLRRNLKTLFLLNNKN